MPYCRCIECHFIFLCIFVVRGINEQKINNSKESEIEIRKPGGIERIQHARKRHTRTCKKKYNTAHSFI